MTVHHDMVKFLFVSQLWETSVDQICGMEVISMTYEVGVRRS